MDEFIILRSKGEKKLNKDIQKFREENPNYEIFNINVGGTEGSFMGTKTFYIIWRLKN